MDNRLDLFIFNYGNNAVFVSVVCLSQMALKHHPDKNPNNPEATEKVSQILPHKLLVTSYDGFEVSSGICLVSQNS